MLSAIQQDVVIVGAGLAGFHTASKLVQRGWQGNITLVGEEPWQPYDRPPLSKQYQTEGAEAALWLMPALPCAVEQVRERKAVAIDTAARELSLDDGSTIAWHHLV